MKKIAILISLLLTVGFAFGQAVGSPPVVENVSMQQSGRYVTVNYDLSYPDNPAESYISLLISADGGTSFRVFPKPDFLDGDIGSGVTVGVAKEIRWHIYGQFMAFGEQGIEGQDFRARVIARREGSDTPEGSSEFVTVQGTDEVTFDRGGLGYFNPGDELSGGIGCNVSLSDFLIGRHPVTQAEYEAVMGSNPSWFTDNPNHPVETISWWSAIEYCNRRSFLEGLIPAYSYLTYGSNPDNWPPDWNMQWQAADNISFITNTNGYRLPTEMEWEYAARGGVPAQNGGTFDSRWAGTNIEDQAGDYIWFTGNSGNTTKAVGTKARNELGLYDMGGNVDEYCWDFYNAAYPNGNFDNPTGTETGTFRVLRGGGYSFTAINCRVAGRNSSGVTNPSINRGFRLARTIVP